MRARSRLATIYEMSLAGLPGLLIFSQIRKNVFFSSKWGLRKFNSLFLMGKPNILVILTKV